MLTTFSFFPQASVPAGVELCGDWPRADIYRRWPTEVADELATFHWPIRSLSELERLFACRHAVPVSISGFDFTAVVREENEAVHMELTISADLRSSLIPGVHACLDVRLVLSMRTRLSGRGPWIHAYLFPPCTHQTLSDTTSGDAKELDGRRFWGILLVIFCMCTYAIMLLVEQPDTVIPRLHVKPTQRVRTSELGDDDDKQLNLFEHGRCLLKRVAPVGGTSGHGHFRDFANAEERDRWRSGWHRFPRTARAVVSVGHNGSPVNCLDFEFERELFAVACFRAGIYVPQDYEHPMAQPALQSDRDYQFARGRGDGRRLPTAIPRSLRAEDGSLCVAEAEVDAGLCLATLAARQVDLRQVNANVVVLCFVIMQTAPLILAALNGFEVIGADLQATTHRSMGLAIATRWAEDAIGAVSSTFLVGEYERGARLFTAPLNHDPDPSTVVRTPSQRSRRARAGYKLAWCTLAALAGTVCYDPAARAAAACSALCGPVDYLPDSAVCGHARLTTFSFGAFQSRPLVDVPQGLAVVSSTLEAALRVCWGEARLLVDRIQEIGERLGDTDLIFWGQAVRPPELQDVPADLLNSLPTFDDARLDVLPFVPVHVPPKLDKLRVKPPQPPAPVGQCPRSAADLMPPNVYARITEWLAASLADLVCMRDLGVDCHRERLNVLVIGRDELYPWARNHVWDFRKSPRECGFPLDYRAPLQPTLNADFFRAELADYPNQRILGMLEDGVIYQADVEMQGVFVPHLTSLPKGYRAVSKELHRLQKLGWYDFFEHIPFWPLYFNAQGSTARKLEPDRDRRTTEGGGPRKATFDRAGLQAISINDASKGYHIPSHYLEDTRPEMLQWMASRRLPPTPQQLAALAFNRGTKWEKQNMPDLRGVANDLAVLRRAGKVLGMPVYLFGDDVKDFFNHMENSPSELPLMNIVFLGADDDLAADARQRAFKDDAGNTLIMISERRMGFGIHPNSGIAQELSEAVDHIFRRRMDAHQDPINEADTRPSMQRWLETRRELEARVGGHQRRLYTSFTFCDDNLIGVVGVEQAITAIRTRRQITHEAGLIMAIPEKRLLGVWGVWLGIAIFTSLGLIVVPRSKLARATISVRDALNSRATFDEYRSLMGLLEHIRHATRWPRRIMHGLYRPHGPEGASRNGPNTIVRPDAFMAKQLRYWITLLASSAGTAFTSVLRRSAIPELHQRVHFYASSDAATDSHPPGMGGFMNGLYWYLPLTAYITYWLHISVLEMLATGFSAIIFGLRLGPHVALTLGADALATPYALTQDSESSEMLIETHHALLDCPEFDQVAPQINLGHLRGDANLASDAVSRAEREVLARLAKNLRTRLTELPTHPSCQRVLDRVLQYAVRRGVPVRPNPYVSSPTVIPSSLLRHVAPPARLPPSRVHAPTVNESGRGKQRRDRIDGDGPALMLRCYSCQVFLLPEHFGLGRCPSCADYDGPGGLYTAAFNASRAPPKVNPPAPARTSALYRATHAAARRAPSTSAPPTAAVAAPSSAPRKRASASQPPVNSRMNSIMVGGQRFAAPGIRKERAISSRKTAMLALAHQRAASMAPPEATAQQRSTLADAVAATHELAEFGAAYGTLDKDDHAWEYYERFCRVYGFEPSFSADFARRCPDQICERLAIFQSWVYPQLRGRGGRPDAKPRTVFNNYVLAVVRTLNREHIPMPKAKSIEKSLAGLMRSFKLVYGVEHLMPGRKQPLTPSMWAKIEALAEGTPLRGRRAAWSPVTRWRDRMLLRLGRTLWRTGHRLGEITLHPSGEVNYLTRSCVSITKANGRKIAVPTDGDWRQLAAGDVVLLAPCASKSDQFGEQHCPFPSVLPHDGSDTSAAAAIRDIELEQPCLPAARKSTAMFADENGRPFTYAILHRELRQLLSALFGEHVASCLTWHSIRIGLACSLHAADCPDAVIQLICRWSCPESLHVYRQMGVDKNIYWTERAQHVTFDATRVNNLPALDADAAMLDNVLAFDPPSTPAATPALPSTTFIIPGGQVKAQRSDQLGLVGLTVAVPRSFWQPSDLQGTSASSFRCLIAAACDREFLHADGTRACTYLIEHQGQHFPIKRAALISACLTQAQRAALQLS